MIKNDKKNKNNEKNSRKIVIFHFLEKFCTLEAKMMKNDKKMKKK